MSEDGDDLVKRQKEFFDAFFKKGAELAEELSRLGGKLGEVERENHHLASLYVAAHRLHASPGPREVVQTVVEILTNFVGAKTFAVYAVAGGALRQLAGENPGGRALAEPAPATEPVLPPEGGLPSDLAPIVVPMLDGGELAGLIVVWELVAHKDAIERVDLELFNLLAARAAGLASLATT
jgi:hypothetical protein